MCIQWSVCISQMYSIILHIVFGLDVYLMQIQVYYCKYNHTTGNILYRFRRFFVLLYCY
jgi:hypothetical protein